MPYKKGLISFAVSVALTSIVFFSIKLVRWSLSDEYDFDLIRKNKTATWIGPEEGKKINLSDFKTRRDEPFPQLPKQSLILLSFADPKCHMCLVSTDLIQRVQSEAKSNQIYFFIVSIVPEDRKAEFFDYAETLPKSDGIYWHRVETDELSDSLQKMVIPSHLLVNEEGIILRRFPGTSSEKNIRDRMASQITTEMLEEKNQS